jgi:hypothetical protein
MNIDHGVRNSIYRSGRVAPRLRLDCARLTISSERCIAMFVSIHVVTEEKTTDIRERHYDHLNISLDEDQIHTIMKCTRREQVDTLVSGSENPVKKHWLQQTAHLDRRERSPKLCMD